jgi:hypothetical protein
MGTAVPRTVAARWWPASAREHRSARGRTPGKGYSGGRSRGDAWRESGQKLNGSEGRAVARGAALTAEQRRQGRSRAEQVLGEEEERGGGSRDLFAKLKNYRDSSVI